LKAHLNHWATERAGPIFFGEAVSGQVVGDLLRRHLQTQEGVHARKVTAQRGGAGGVERTVAAAGALDLELPLDFQPPERVSSSAAVREQIGQHPVFGDVRLKAGAVDDVVGMDLLCAAGARHQAAEHPVRPGGHLLHGALHRVVVATLGAIGHLLLPPPALGCVGTAHFLVLLRPLRLPWIVDIGQNADLRGGHAGGSLSGTAGALDVLAGRNHAMPI
jgi:hypothetical protein